MEGREGRRETETNKEIDGETDKLRQSGRDHGMKCYIYVYISRHNEYVVM